MFNESWETLAVEANYRPSEVARLCKVSLRTIQRHFATHFGLTVSEWLRNLRLNQAYVRIKKGEQIKVVAYDLGYKQLSHFSRAFKDVYGIAPSLVSRGGMAPELRVILAKPEAHQEVELASSF